MFGLVLKGSRVFDPAGGVDTGLGLPLLEMIRATTINPAPAGPPALMAWLTTEE